MKSGLMIELESHYFYDKWVYLQTGVIITMGYPMVTVTTTTRRFSPMKIQFSAKASIHSSDYKSIYIRIPKSAWIAYRLERLLGKLIQVNVWELDGEEPIARFTNFLKRHRDTARFVTTMWTDLKPVYYIVTIEEYQ